MRTRKRNLFLGFGTVLLALVVYYGLWPLVNHYRATLATLRSDVRELRRDRSLLRRAPQILERTRRTRSRLRRTLPPVRGERTFSALLSRLEEQAHRAGIPDTGIDRINQVSGRTLGGLRERRVRARFRGITVEQFARLLGRFRTRPGPGTILRYEGADLRMDPRGRGRLKSVDLHLVLYGWTTRFPPGEGSSR